MLTTKCGREQCGCASCEKNKQNEVGDPDSMAGSTELRGKTHSKISQLQLMLLRGCTSFLDERCCTLLELKHTLLIT
jgi:hypothetical protein